jgi:hypothetical protein
MTTSPVGGLALSRVSLLPPSLSPFSLLCPSSSSLFPPYGGVCSCLQQWMRCVSG